MAWKNYTLGKFNNLNIVYNLDLMKSIKIRLFASLKEKAGFSHREYEILDNTTVKQLKISLEVDFPSLRTHLDNVLVLIGNESAIDEDEIPADSIVTFLTPIGGG